MTQFLFFNQMINSHSCKDTTTYHKNIPTTYIPKEGNYERVFMKQLAQWKQNNQFEHDSQVIKLILKGRGQNIKSYNIMIIISH